MIAHSQEAADQIAAGPVCSHRAKIQRLGQTMLNWDEILLVSAPTVALDENIGSQRTWSGQILDPDGTLAPRIGSDALAPYGSELVYEIGIRLPSTGEYEWIPGGVYRLEGVKANSGRIITVDGAPDRSSVIARARNEEPYVIHGGTLYDAINDYMQIKYPGIPFVADPGASVTSLLGSPRVYQEGDADSDPWSNMRELAASFGRRLSVDASGTAVLEVIPDPSKQVITWAYTPGDANLAIGGETLMDTSTLYNVWVVSGEGTGIDPPVRAVVEITDTADPLFAGPGGSIGRRPRFFTSSFLTTTAECQAAGEGFRRSQQGASSSVSFSAVPNPLHEPTDLIRYRSVELGVDYLLALSAWNLPGDLKSASSYKTRLVTG